MLKLLVKKQLTEIFRAYIYDAKKNRARSKAATVGYIIFFVLLMVGVIGGMFTTLSLTMCRSMAEAGMSWFYFAIMGLMAILLGAFGSVFTTYSSLYLPKDNDQMLSLPIPVDTLIAARLLGVYLMGLMYSGVVVLPAIIVYWATVSAAPLHRQYLLAHQQPPVKVLPGRNRPDLRHSPHGRVDQAEPGGLLLCGQGFQHQRGCGKPPLSGAGGRVVNGDGDRPLARPDKFLPSERVSGTFSGRKTEQSAHPKAFHRFPSSAPEGG